MAFQRLGRVLLLALVAGAGCALVGCGGAAADSELSMRPKPRALKGAETVRIPQSEPFSIALEPTSETPGLGGSASADADVNSTGSAKVSAVVERSGQATAGFQLGHSFKNDTDRQVTFNVRASCAYQVQAASTPAVDVPDASVRLKLYVRGNLNQLVREFSLLEHTTELGSVTGTNTEQIEFSLVVGAREAVHIFFAGFAAIDVADERTARASITAEDVTLEVTPTPAPAVGMGGN